MDILAIITLVMAILEKIAPIIADCVEANVEGAKRLRRSAIRAYWEVHSQLLDEGCTPREARYGARYAFGNLIHASDDELVRYISACHASVAAGHGEPEIED